MPRRSDTRRILKVMKALTDISLASTVDGRRVLHAFAEGDEIDVTVLTQEQIAKLTALGAIAEHSRAKE